MSLTGSDVAHLLLALALLLASAHAIGHLFVLCRQPRVIGEILGGLLLGPTVLGAVAPDLQSNIFPDSGPTAAWLGGTYQLGLLLLMFASGAEMRSIFRRGEARLVTIVTVAGVALPFLAGAVLFRFLDPSTLQGEARNSAALLLVFALAIAVTSIPVISRIMLDLRIIDTPFARIVLGVAVIEDVVVYLILAVALSLVAPASQSDFGLPALLNLRSGSAGSLLFHIAATLLFFAVVLSVGGRGFRWFRRQRWNLLASGSPIAYLLVFVFGSTLICLALGITPLLGAFLAGVATSAGLGSGAEEARASIVTFSTAFWVPIYFALVGLQLDLLRHFDLIFFAWFLAFACLTKSISVYGGARLAGESPRGSRNLAIATNARGGPGIVLASVSFTAGIINQEFYAALVMLAIVTSLLAGSWLGHIVRRGEPLRDDLPPRPVTERGEASTRT
jgi:K+:H+ antiporter